MTVWINRWHFKILSEISVSEEHHLIVNACVKMGCKIYNFPMHITINTAWQVRNKLVNHILCGCIHVVYAALISTSTNQHKHAK